MSKKSRMKTTWAALIAAWAMIPFLGIAMPVAAQYDIYDLGTNARSHDIKADNNNTLHIIWVDLGILYYGKIINNAISGKVQVATAVDTSMWRPYLSVRPDGGSVHIAWTTTGFGNSLMHSWKTTGGWNTEHVLSVPGTQKLSQAICAIDSSGLVHMMFVIWNNVPGNDWATIFYTRKLATGNWESKQQFIPYDAEYKHPFLINDSQGQVHATWTLQGRLGTDSFESYYCMAPSGGKLSYTSMIKIPKAPDSDVNGYGELFIDRHGVVHRTICGWSNAEWKICLDHSKKLIGAGFEIPTRPSLGFLDVWTDPMPVVVAGEDGKAIVAWGEIGSDGSNTVKASFYDPGKRAWSLVTVDPAAGIPRVHYGYRVALTRTDTHVFGIWLGSNGHITLIVIPIDFTVKNDFNKDGKGDILWRNYANGSNAVLFLDGINYVGKAKLPALTNTNWKIEGTGDFNSDGNVDILWRHYGNGSNRVAYFDGVTQIGAASLPTVTNMNWQIAGTGDFNYDGRVDIVWRNYNNGSNRVWFMDGVTQIGTGDLPTVANTNWKIACTGDFNNDGKVDIVWRNYNNGSNRVWYMDGITQTGTGTLPSETDTLAEIEGTGDFNGDGKTDVLWRHYGTGANWVWYMNGVTQTGTGWLPTLSILDWRIENH